MKPTYANVMSTVAVFIAMGGTSYAVASLPKGSVGESQLRKSAVTGEKVKDGSLTGADLAAGTLQTGRRGPRGADGATGPAGAAGQTGPAGPSEAWHTSGAADGSLSRERLQRTVVARISNLPPGQYAFHASVSIVANNVGSADPADPTATTYCSILTNGESRGSAVGIFGNAPGATQAGTLSAVGAATMKDGFQATLECWNWQDFPQPREVPSFQQVGFDAIRVGSLEQR